MLTRWPALVSLVLVTALLAGCGGGASTATDRSSGGFTGTDATLYDYAYTQCLALGTTAATAGTSVSHKPVAIYSFNVAYPTAMIGKVRPHNADQWKATKDGCAVAVVDAFAGARSAQTAAVCKHLAPWLPADLRECRNTA